MLVVRTLANDTPELDPAGRPYADGDLVRFDPARRPSGSTLPRDHDGTRLVVPGQGTYTIDYGSGDVAFVPDPTFRGTATAFYLDVPGGLSRFQVTVTGVDPRATADVATTAAGTAKRIAVLANDEPGVPARPLVPGSVRLRPSPGTPTDPEPTPSADGQILTIPGRGVYAVAGDGSITFHPLAGVTGTADAVYSVLDVNGTRTDAALSVRVS